MRNSLVLVLFALFAASAANRASAQPPGAVVLCVLPGGAQGYMNAGRCAYLHGHPSDRIGPVECTVGGASQLAANATQCAAAQQQHLRQYGY